MTWLWCALSFVAGVGAGVGVCVWLNRNMPGDPFLSAEVRHLRNAEPRQ